MIKLTNEVKRMLNALAYANEAEYLTLPQKHRALASGTAPALAAADLTPAKKSGPQIGLYLGSELPADVMQYVMQTCTRLKHGLTVLTFQSEAEAQALLKPYLTELENARIGVELSLLGGEPPTALIHALRKRAEIAFLVCNESGYLGRGLLKGIVRQDAFPIPVVMVAPSDAAAKPEQAEKVSATARAA